MLAWLQTPLCPLLVDSFIPVCQAKRAIVWESKEDRPLFLIQRLQSLIYGSLTVRHHSRPIGYWWEEVLHMGQTHCQVACLGFDLRTDIQKRTIQDPFSSPFMGSRFLLGWSLLVQSCVYQRHPPPQPKQFPFVCMCVSLPSQPREQWVKHRKTHWVYVWLRHRQSYFRAEF